MPENLNVDLNELNRLADKHRQVAADTREWGKPPQSWLNAFRDNYGTIANPVHSALINYYDARQKAAEALAKAHEGTADALNNAATSYANTDHDNAASINRAGNNVNGGVSGGGSAPIVPMTPMTPMVTPTNPAGTPDAGFLNGFQNNYGSIAQPVQQAPGMPGMPGSAGVPTGAQPGQSDAQQPDMMPMAPAAGDIPVDASTGSSMPPVPPLSVSGDGTVAGGGFGPMGPGGIDATGPSGPSGPPSGGGHAAPGTDGNSDAVPVAMPFAAVAAAAVEREKEKQHEPAVVGGEPDEDLLLARAVLGAVLAATPAVVGLDWAVSVMHGPAGKEIFVTSNEGRGWLPAGLYLPKEIAVPWVAGVDSAGLPWEGIADPARVLVEYGLESGRRSGSRLTAVVSSQQIDADLRTELGSLPMEGPVGVSTSMNFDEPDATRLDRLAVVADAESLNAVDRVPEPRLRSACLGLAWDAHTRGASKHSEAAPSREVRDRILLALRENRIIPDEWWTELRDTDDMLGATMVTRRVNATRIGLGELRVDPGTTPLRELVFERRCNELVALLEGDTTRQTLRDATYAHSQILTHPLFTATPQAGAVAPEAEGRAAAGAAGGVTAPGAGVSAPPAVVPPTSVPDGDEKKAGS